MVFIYNGNVTCSIYIELDTRHNLKNKILRRELRDNKIKRTRLRHSGKAVQA